jgi:hypothetical protein
MGALETDYLVVGAGASGMAFTDEVVSHSDADVLLVDRRDVPGGHWNDAYPFVRLHLPSPVYGVNSRSLGADRIDQGGPNAGMYERATGAEVRDYYQRLLDEQFLPSGRVSFVGLHDANVGVGGGYQVTSRLTGDIHDVVVRRKVVDATYLETSVPSTHAPSFEIAEGVRFVTVADLVRVPEPAGRYVIVGAGKTAIDACIWLREHDVPSERIRWIRPRDAWLLNRAGWQPLQLLPAAMDGLSLELEALAQASSAEDLFGRLEACGRLVRIDRDVLPTMYHCATVDSYELELLRSVGDVVRLGHVRRLSVDGIELERGTVEGRPDDLYVDCSAYGLRRPPVRPIFEQDRVTIQQVRYCSPTFNAALIGYVESTRSDIDEQNRLCPATAYPDVAHDWLRVLYTTMLAASAWRHEPDLLQWLENSRLNLLRGIGDLASDPQMGRALQRYGENLRPAMHKLREMLVPSQATGLDHQVPVQSG